jgi:hypothetical protein
MSYPTAFPADQALALAAYLRGASTESLPVLVEDAYDLAGYGLRLMLGGKPALMKAGHSDAPGSSEEAAEKLTQLAHTAHQEDAAEDASGAPGARAWSPPGWLVPFALDLIQRLLTAWQTQGGQS